MLDFLSSILGKNWKKKNHNSHLCTAEQISKNVKEYNQENNNYQASQSPVRKPEARPSNSIEGI